MASASREMKASTIALIDSLDDERKASVQRPFMDGQRKKWDFWPGRYPGLDINDLSGKGLEQAKNLLRSGLSERGYTKVEIIRELEKYNPWSSPRHYLLIFGDPKADKRWGWRFQGHHISLNFTVADGQAVANTPAFLGSQPLSHPRIRNGAAPLEKEKSIGLKFFQLLDDSKKERARVRRPNYAYLPQRTEDGEKQAPVGLKGSEMSIAERAILKKLIFEYVDNIAPAIAAKRKEEIERIGIGKAAFAFAGSARPDRNHYYRIQGPSFIIEYDSRDNGSHIHSVWRDFDGDFGEDLLRQHYATRAH